MNGEHLFGPRIGSHGTIFRLWAPAARSVELLADGRFAMAHLHDGWFEINRPQIPAGIRYKFRIDDQIDVPDPASHFQPEDVHGPSELIDHRFDWAATDWKGRP